MLLGGRNLLSRMYRGNQRITLVPIEIPIAYCLEVRRMKKERIDAVLALADRICDMVKKENAPKLLYPIESARYIYHFRASLLKLLKKNISMGEAQPLFTTDDFIHKLLPDGEPWTDVRDLMLIRIYEKLHEFLQHHREEVSDETIEIPVEESQAF
jgi:CRISPR-associated protein Cst1